MAWQTTIGRAAARAAGQAYMTHKIGQQQASRYAPNSQTRGVNGGLQVNPNNNGNQFKMSTADRLSANWHTGRYEAGRPLDYSADSLPTFAPDKDIEVPRLKF